MRFQAPLFRPWWASIALTAIKGSVVCLLVAGVALPARAETEALLDRITNKQVREYEGKLTDNIGRALSRYISPSQYVLSVKVIWNKNAIPVMKTPETASDKQKLPGFPIFVGAPGSEAMGEATPSFVRMVIKVLLDETLPEYYERFVRKITPIVARFDAERGDQVIVLKETFPVRKKEELPPTLPEKVLMEQLGKTQGQFPQTMGAEVPPPPGPRQGRTPSQPSPLEAAQLAYEEGRLQDALRIVQFAFQRASTNQERALFLGMEGSVQYTLKNNAGALAAWRRALTYDPTNLEIQRVMNFMEKKSTGGSP